MVVVDALQRAPALGDVRLARILADGQPDENALALEVSNALTEQDLREIDLLFPAGAAAGARYAEVGMKTLNR